MRNEFTYTQGRDEHNADVTRNYWVLECMAQKLIEASQSDSFERRNSVVEFAAAIVTLAYHAVKAERRMGKDAIIEKFIREGESAMTKDELNQLRNCDCSMVGLGNRRIYPLDSGYCDCKAIDTTTAI